ncbi:LPS export ABC transporter periplasmic protein LptC [Novosphingobium sp. FSY-8]|uniref:LPS export ABC transporter periplasmic protein LptC n=1 Tax=Novosphingobium ovatum TaxID=1908523 RepID=A0ABW9XGV1_9SPHN|nr:LPS export ABC transporter periplasmic protein LptC [Novosphingobium ovatum]NBC37637.1 LPS export ABC transporter periplasmic protein LptC [Novosphingobium ovatum]
MITAAMVISPLFPHSEVSFLLDRNKVALTHERFAVTGAVYRGTDDRGRAFTLSAGQALQHSAHDAILEMRELHASLNMTNGLASVEAPSARYFIDKEKLQVAGPTRFSESGGYKLQTSGVTIDIKTRKAFADGGVTGTLPTGTFSAQSMSVDLDTHHVVLDGRARLRMQ